MYKLTHLILCTNKYININININWAHVLFLTLEPPRWVNLPFFYFWLVKKLAVLHMWNWYSLTFHTLAIPVIWCKKHWEHHVTQPYKIHLKPPKWVNLPSNSRCCGNKVGNPSTGHITPTYVFPADIVACIRGRFPDPNAGKHDNQYYREDRKCLQRRLEWRHASQVASTTKSLHKMWCEIGKQTLLDRIEPYCTELNNCMPC